MYNPNIPLDRSTKRELERALTPFSVGEFSRRSTAQVGEMMSLHPLAGCQLFKHYRHFPEGVHVFAIPELSPSNKLSFTYYFVGLQVGNWYWLNTKEHRTVVELAGHAKRMVRAYQSARRNLFMRVLLGPYELLFPGNYIRSRWAQMLVRFTRLTRNPDVIPTIAAVQRPTLRQT